LIYIYKLGSIKEIVPNDNFNNLKEFKKTIIILSTGPIFWISHNCGESFKANYIPLSVNSFKINPSKSTIALVSGNKLCDWQEANDNTCQVKTELYLYDLQDNHIKHLISGISQYDW